MIFIKKWKIINKVTLALLLFFVLIILWNAISCYMYDGKYPYPALGIDIYNWYEQFWLNMAFISYVLGIPFAIDIILLVISVIKIKKLKSINK